MAHILVIDDSPSVVLSVERLLLGDGHTVGTVTEVLELPRYLRNTPPDLVLLDLEMPGLPGVAWASIMRRCQSRRLSILIHSSKSWATLQSAAREVNAAGIIPKGASPDAIRCIINSALQRTTRAMG